MTASRIFLYFCLSFIAGIFLNSFLRIPQLLMLSFLILGLILISVLFKYKKLVVVGFCLLFLALGIWRYQQTELKIIDNELRKHNDSEETMSLTGVIKSEPDIRESNTKLTVEIEGLKGKVLVTTNRYPEYQYGDKLKIVGELKTPQEFPDFNYKDYLAKDGIYSVIYYPEIELIGKNQGNLVFAKILFFKSKLRESIYRNLSPPQSSILGAMILGDKRQMSDDLKEKLNIAGVRHITAVSGLHVVVLTSILMTVLIGLGFWRKQAFYFTLILITLFIIMTGLQPSAIRAGIMGGLFLLAQHLGRLNISFRAVVFAGAVMLIQSPLLLKLDVGFQLSFLAIIGIIYLSPIFQSLFSKIPNSFQLRSILVMTFSAYLFTLPVLVYNFGYISLAAPITNILIVPLLYWVMILGFIFGLVGMAFQSLGWLLSFPAWLLLTYITKVVDFFSSISFASYTLEISWIFLVILYLVLGLTVWRWQEKQKLKFLQY